MKAAAANAASFQSKLMFRSLMSFIVDPLFADRFVAVYRNVARTLSRKRLATLSRGNSCRGF
jgi:hypothetical protein